MHLKRKEFFINLFQHDIESLNVSRSQLQQHIIEVENERMVKINQIDFIFKLYFYTHFRISYKK